MEDLLPFLFGVWVLLVCYVGFRISNRIPPDSRNTHRVMDGTAFDVSKITPRIRVVRESLPTVSRTRTRNTIYRLGLLAAARQMIARLDYFHRIKGGHDEPNQNLNHHYGS